MAESKDDGGQSKMATSERVDKYIAEHGSNWQDAFEVALDCIAALEAELEGIREREPSRVVVSELQVMIAELRSESDNATKRANKAEAELKHVKAERDAALVRLEQFERIARVPQL